MYDFPRGPQRYADPWKLGIGDRMRLFHRRPRKVVYYCHEANNSSFRYRAYAMAQVLNEAPIDVGASWFHRTDGPALDQVFRGADVVVVCRSEYTARLAELIGSAQERGIPVFFDSDDVVFEPKLIPTILNTLNQEMPDKEDELIWMVWFSMIGRLRATLELCDAFIGSTRSLLEQAAPIGLPVHHLPNFLTREQWAYSHQLVADRQASGDRRDGRIHIGYFSGTPTHVKDLELASDALRALLKRRSDVVVRLVGYMTAEDAGLEGFEDQVEKVPFTDYLNLQRVIAETEISIAPLQDNTFTRCKSELKWFDAAAVSIPALVSPTTSMTDAITDGVDGIVVANHEWLEAMEATIDDDLGRRIGRQAYETVSERYRPEGFLQPILSVLGLS